MYKSLRPAPPSRCEVRDHRRPERVDGWRVVAGGGVELRNHDRRLPRLVPSGAGRGPDIEAPRAAVALRGEPNREPVSRQLRRVFVSLATELIDSFGCSPRVRNLIAPRSPHVVFGRPDPRRSRARADLR